MKAAGLLLLKCVGVLALSVGVFFLLPKSKCCDQFDPAYENLIQRASAGELEAIRTLYQESTRNGVDAEEEHWAREGALLGDAELRIAFVEIFRTRIDPERQQRLISSIKERSALPGGPCLLRLLQTAPNGDGNCQ